MNNKATISQTLYPDGCIQWEIDAGFMAATDYAYSVVKNYVEHISQAKVDWKLAIFDIYSNNRIEIDCKPSEFAEVVSFICSIEHVGNMTFIRDDPFSKSCLVGLGCSRGNIDIPGYYEYKNEHLRKIAG